MGTKDSKNQSTRLIYHAGEFNSSAFFLFSSLRYNKDKFDHIDIIYIIDVLVTKMLHFFVFLFKFFWRQYENKRNYCS